MNNRQHQIVDFVRDFQIVNGYAPTMREIANGVGLKAVSNVHVYLERLEDDGIIERKKDIPRAIKILRDDRAE